MGALSIWHWLIVLAVVLLLFGSRKLPEMARGLGRSARIFKSEIKEMQNDGKEGEDAEDPQETRALTEGAQSNTAQFTGPQGQNQPQAHPAQQPVSQGYPQAPQQPYQQAPPHTQSPQQSADPTGQAGPQQPHGGQ